MLNIRGWSYLPVAEASGALGTVGARKERRIKPRKVMGERREVDGFLVCWDGDGGRPGGRMILWWWWRRKVKGNCAGGGASERRRRGWGGSNN